MELVRMDTGFHYSNKDYYMDGRMDMDEEHMDKHQNSIQVGNMGQDFDIVNITPGYFQNIYRNVFFCLTQ